MQGAAGEDDTFASKALLLAACFFGLQLSYVTWGILQEKLMTKSYETGMFPSSTFLVFANRFLAIFVAIFLVLYSHYRGSSASAKPRPGGNSGNSNSGGGPLSRIGHGLSTIGFAAISTGAPLWMFAPHSLSNVLSSFCQYEALKYVTFPTQVLFKSNKIIPVMLVGRFLQKKAYPWREYVEALIISLGVALFMLSERGGGGHKHAAAPSLRGADAPSESSSSMAIASALTTAGSDGGADGGVDGSDGSDSTAEGIAFFYGVVLLSFYLCSDSFTSQWQDRVYKSYKLNQFQMMLGTNLMSITFTLCHLMYSGELLTTLQFLVTNAGAFGDVCTLSLCSAVGQLFIFYTIKKFGPVVFTIMMTTRQMLSMLFSCMIFGHTIGGWSMLGAAVVFGTLIARIKRKYNERKK